MAAAQTIALDMGIVQRLAMDALAIALRDILVATAPIVGKNYKLIGLK